MCHFCPIKIKSVIKSNDHMMKLHSIKSAGLVFLYLLLKPLDGAHVDLLTFVIKNRDIHVKIY